MLNLRSISLELLQPPLTHRQKVGNTKNYKHFYSSHRVTFYMRNP
jgi:hypothetical protein